MLTFTPSFPIQYKQSPLVFLANIQPELQLEVLDQMPHARLTVLDTMELWLNTAKEQLTEVIKRVDILLLSEEEVRHYTEQASILKGVRQLVEHGFAICSW